MFDLSGNVSELAIGNFEGFKAIGGSFADEWDALVCGAFAPPTYSVPTSHIGFRCCTPR